MFRLYMIASSAFGVSVGVADLGRHLGLWPHQVPALPNDLHNDLLAAACVLIGVGLHRRGHRLFHEGLEMGRRLERALRPPVDGTGGVVVPLSRAPIAPSPVPTGPSNGSARR